MKRKDGLSIYTRKLARDYERKKPELSLGLQCGRHKMMVDCFVIEGVIHEHERLTDLLPSDDPLIIIEKTNQLAIDLYRQYGYHCEDGFEFYNAVNPQISVFWRMACIAQKSLCGFDPMRCLWMVGG